MFICAVRLWLMVGFVCVSSSSSFNHQLNVLTVLLSDDLRAVRVWQLPSVGPYHDFKIGLRISE